MSSTGKEDLLEASKLGRKVSLFSEELEKLLGYARRERHQLEPCERSVRGQNGKDGGLLSEHRVGRKDDSKPCGWLDWGNEQVSRAGQR